MTLLLTFKMLTVSSNNSFDIYNSSLSPKQSQRKRIYEIKNISWNIKLSRIQPMFSFLHVHCKFLACGQSVHYGRSLAFFLLIHNIYPQFLIMISFRLPWKLFFSSFLSMYASRESVWEYTARKERKKNKVQSESREWNTIQAPHRPITPSSRFCARDFLDFTSMSYYCLGQCWSTFYLWFMLGRSSLMNDVGA